MPIAYIDVISLKQAIKVFPSAADVGFEPGVRMEDLSLKINPNLDLSESQRTSQLSSAEVSGKPSNTPAVSSSNRDTTDRANLSPDALQLSNLSATLATLPAIRQDKVASATQSIQNGTFSPSNDQIAHSLLRDFRSSTPANV